MVSAAQLPDRVSLNAARRALLWGATGVIRPLHALISFPSLMFMAALTAMLFRPPDLKFYGIDRIALLALMFAVLLRALMTRQSLRAARPVLLPMCGLLVLTVAGALFQPYEADAWSVIAAKWIVPCTLFYMAGLVFESAADFRRFETFALVVLGYLTITAILFLSGTKSLIFPPFIVDESIGIHADRARGPFLQALANGVTLNLLGLVALDSYRRGRLRGVLALAFVIALPLAVLATKTRAVWASFVLLAVALLFFSPSRRVRYTCLFLVVTACIALLCALAFQDLNRSLRSRLEERSPVQFRMAMYRAGWDMFRAKPLFGWGTAQMQPELARRISEFHQDKFYFHNTFLEVAVEHGLVGLALYLWVVFDLARVGRRSAARSPAPDGDFLDLPFRSLWPVFLGVYLLNACFVVMNYQFVNGLLFTVAGMLAAQNQAQEGRVYAHCC